MTNIISSNHHLWKAIPDVDIICEPLFRETELSYFNYARAYDDGTVAGLFTHPQWLLHSLQQRVAPSSVEFRGFSHYTLFGSDIEPPSPISLQKHRESVTEFKELLGFDYMLCINYQQPDYYEAFAFATYINNSKIIEFYLNKLDYLEKFTTYFKEKAASLIKNAALSENKIIRFEKKSSDSSKKTKNTIHPNTKLIVRGKESKPLTAREIECLAYISKGRSAKEISNILGVSNRTIETHIQNMKIKLGCHRKSELIDIAVNHRLDVFYKKVTR